eukprot:15463029-Alexandrium_andersonii.AAC.2
MAPASHPCWPARRPADVAAEGFHLLKVTRATTEATLLPFALGPSRGRHAAPLGRSRLCAPRTGDPARRSRRSTQRHGRGGTLAPQASRYTGPRSVPAPPWYRGGCG